MEIDVLLHTFYIYKASRLAKQLSNPGTYESILIKAIKSVTLVR